MRDRRAERERESKARKRRTPMIEGADTESHLYEASGFCIHRRPRIRRGVPYLTGRYRPELCVTYRQIILPSLFHPSARFRPSRNSVSMGLRFASVRGSERDPPKQARAIEDLSGLELPNFRFFLTQIVLPWRKYFLWLSRSEFCSQVYNIIIIKM